MSDSIIRTDVPPEGLRVLASGIGCGVDTVDGVADSVTIRMSLDLGALTLVPGVHLSPEWARQVANHLLKLADKVEQRVKVCDG